MDQPHFLFFQMFSREERLHLLIYLNNNYNLLLNPNLSLYFIIHINLIATVNWVSWYHDFLGEKRKKLTSLYNVFVKSVI